MKLTKRDVDDVYRLDFGPGTAPIILSEEEMDELRAHLQAERDEQLGRWRDPENVDMVAYRKPKEDDGCGRCIILLNETTGATSHEWERLAYSDLARRYFAAHPQPEPEPKPRPPFAAYVDKNGSAVWVTDENGNLRCLSDQNLDPEKYAPFTRLLPDE